MRILLLSAYDAHSHRRWRQGLVAAFPEWQWTVLTLPPRFFSWRVRGNSLSWAFSERKTLEQPYDVLIATSMTDLSALKGLVPALASIPSLVYCHENQFVYPDHREGQRIEPKITSLYTLLSADRVVFNSDWNRESFLAGAQALLAQMPDAVPPGVVESIAGKSCILPVPLEQRWFDRRTSDADGEQHFTIVWNHRWEYDKAPERLFGALLKLHEAGEDFRVHVTGQQFRQQPPVFDGRRHCMSSRDWRCWRRLHPVAYHWPPTGWPTGTIYRMIVVICLSRMMRMPRAVRSRFNYNHCVHASKRVGCLWHRL
jgi:glycosyltransferase involved in cell wall biosynthesis